MELLQQIFELCIVPLLGVLTAYLVQLIRNKTSEAAAKTNSEITQKYLDLAQDTICRCVIATNQTFVDSMKMAGEFDEKAAKKAFKETYEAVMLILTDDAKNYISSAVGDLQLYITKSIEATVKTNKLEITE